MQQAMKVMSRRARMDTASIGQTTGLRALAMFHMNRLMLPLSTSLPDSNGGTTANI